MSFNFKYYFGNYHFSILLLKTQHLKGITSKVGSSEPSEEGNDKRKHYIFWDLEKCNLEACMKALKPIQILYNLGNIYVTSDAEKSFRAWCFSIREWKEYLRILLETEFVDYNFFYWTVRRGSATLRTSKKVDREEQKVIAFLKGYEETELPERVNLVYYETGIKKISKAIKLEL